MRRSRTHLTSALLTSAVFATGLLACTADRPETPATDATPATTEAPPPEPAADQGQVTMRYTCEGDHSVAVHGEASASVTMADGTRELPRVSNSAPPQFADDLLSFSIHPKGAEVGHAGVGTFACQPAE